MPAHRNILRRSVSAASVCVLLLVVTGCAAAQEPSAADQVAVARARRYELDTPAVPPPGERLSHEAAGYAQIMCNAVFITGLDADFASEHVGYFTAPYASRARLGKPVIDLAAKTVEVAVPGGAPRLARYLGSQGCLAFPVGESQPHYTPERVRPHLPDPSRQDWPMGDRVSTAPLPAGIDTAKVRAAVEAAFASPNGFTAAYVVTWKGRIVAERYASGVGMHTPLESWSMGKSVTATLLGLLIADGKYDLWQPAPIPEWQTPGDPRAAIRIADLLRMSSGCASERHTTPTTTRRARIRSTFISIPARSTRSTTRRHARSSFRRTRWGATAIRIPYSSTTSFDWR